MPPNILFVMTDNQRFDTIAALGNELIYTPNLDRLVRRGLAFQRAYTTCTVCIPARYTIRTGCEVPTTRVFSNIEPRPLPTQPQGMEDRCGGPYLAKTMRRLGYRTFGIGKFHSRPWNEDLGYDVQLYSEEIFPDADRRGRDHYHAWLAKEHPEYDFVETPMGERTDMMYMPQMSPMPAHVNVEWWAADRAIEHLAAGDGRPYFGMVSFVGPHPALAPPVPFNRMYDPDRMPNPFRGDPASDLMDPGIPGGNYGTYAEDVTDSRARVLKARYYGEISYIDHGLGRILDAVEARGDAENTLIAFFTDHGENFGDHGAWGKVNFFETACHIPFLVSWPSRLPAGQRRQELVCLADLFGIATHAAGAAEVRQGIDVLGVLAGQAAPRDAVFGYYGMPGVRQFRMMVRDQRYKYLFYANGGREQLFNLQEDPRELRNLAGEQGDLAKAMRAKAAAACRDSGLVDAMDNDDLKVLEFRAPPLKRIVQFDKTRGVEGFPAHPGDAIKNYKFKTS